MYSAHSKYVFSRNTILGLLKLAGGVVSAGILLGCQSIPAIAQAAATAPATPAGPTRVNATAPLPVPTASPSGSIRFPGFIQAPRAVVSPFAVELPVGAQWNELMLSAIRDSPAFPTVASHQMFMVSAAMYDAHSMYTESAKPYAIDTALRRPASEHTEENRLAAVSQAAFQMLVYLYPNYEFKNGYFLRYLTSLGLAPASNVGELPEEIGYAATLATIIRREGDGSYIEHDYAIPIDLIDSEIYVAKNDADPESDKGITGDAFDPNRWQPLRVANGRSVDQFSNPAVDLSNPRSYQDQTFLTPYWENVEPFALTSKDQFRADPPPYYGSDESYTDALGVVSTNQEAYIKQFNEVLQSGQNLTDEEKVISEYWADGPRTESPPGHWNQIAQGVVERDNMNLGQSTQLFFTLNAALLDAGIAAWETKRYYDYIRPVSAIRRLYLGNTIRGWAGPNRGIRNIPAVQWIPYQKLTFVTPPFPEYISGHSAFSRAASEVLTMFTGSGIYYDGKTKISHDIDRDSIPDFFGEYFVQPGQLLFESGPEQSIVLRWSTFHQAADQAGRSRIFGGIHIQDSDLRGREMGSQVGRQSFCKAQEFFGEQSFAKLCEAYNRGQTNVSQN